MKDISAANCLFLRLTPIFENGSDIILTKLIEDLEFMQNRHILIILTAYCLKSIQHFFERMDKTLTKKEFI